jgi:carbon storage regulator
VPAPPSLDGVSQAQFAWVATAVRRFAGSMTPIDHWSYAADLTGDTTKEQTMLVLSRKKNESIVINNDITIVVVEIRGDKVRLGVEAPKEVPVHRREVYDAIRRNDVAAQTRASTNGDADSSTSSANNT